MTPIRSRSKKFLEMDLPPAFLPSVARVVSIAAMLLTGGCSTPVEDSALLFAPSRESAKARTEALKNPENGMVAYPDPFDMALSADLVLAAICDPANFEPPFGVFEGIGKIEAAKDPDAPSGRYKLTLTREQLKIISQGPAALKGVVYFIPNEKGRKGGKELNAQFVWILLEDSSKDLSGTDIPSYMGKTPGTRFSILHTKQIKITREVGTVDFVAKLGEGNTFKSPPAIMWVVPKPGKPLELKFDPAQSGEIYQAQVKLEPENLAGIKASGGLTVSIKGVFADDKTEEITVSIPLEEATVGAPTLNVLPKDVVAKEFGAVFAAMFYACDLTIVNSDTEHTLLVYGSSLTQEVRYSLNKKDVKKELGSLSPGLLTAANAREYIAFKEDRRPMAFSDILAVFNYARQSQDKQQAINWMKSAGTLAVALEAVFKDAGYARGVSIFTGPFTTELEKRLLWDVLLHVENLQARSLKEVEEVAPGGQLHRLVFFPKYPISGLMPGVDVYISEISDNKAQVVVAKIQKISVVTSSPSPK